MLEMRNLCRSFGGIAVTGAVSFALEPGERRVILGPNGAGGTPGAHRGHTRGTQGTHGRAHGRCARGPQGHRRQDPDVPAAPLPVNCVGRAMTATVRRETQTSRPASSVISMPQTWLERPM